MSYHLKAHSLTDRLIDFNDMLTCLVLIYA